MGNGIYEVGKKYARDVVIPCYMSDRKYDLKPGSFMDIAQEMAMDGAEKLGFGYSKLFPLRMAWVLSRMHVHYVDAPKWCDDGTVYTWHRGVDGLFYRRDYEYKVGDRLCIAATSSWVIINLDTRALEHPEVMAELAGSDPQDEAMALPSSAPRIRMPRGITPEKARDHVVAYSDVDFNGHANNTRYIAWVMDCVDPEVAYSRPVKDVYINYSKEIYAGETVQIFRAVEQTEDTLSYTFEGIVGDHTAFLAKVVF